MALRQANEDRSRTKGIEEEKRKSQRREQRQQGEDKERTAQMEKEKEKLQTGE